jgi:hypothetical protein
MEIREHTEAPKKHSIKIPRLPITFKTGSYKMSCDVLLILIVCKHCKTPFYMCRSCFRGHIYCSHHCRNRAYVKACRIVQSKYRTSEKGKRTHRFYEQNRRRIGRYQKIKKSMADETTRPSQFRVISFPVSPGTKPKCSFCGSFGKVVSAFPLRW